MLLKELSKHKLSRYCLLTIDKHILSEWSVVTLFWFQFVLYNYINNYYVYENEKFVVLMYLLG